MIDALRKMGIECAPPRGAFYAFAKVSQFGNSVEVTEKLLRDALVAVTPGSAFGPNGEGYVRLSYATSRQKHRGWHQQNRSITGTGLALHPTLNDFANDVFSA